MTARIVTCGGLTMLACLQMGCSPTPPEEPGETRIVGTVVGYDGKPIRKSGIYVFYQPQGLAIEFAEADPSGHFELRTKRTGLLLLRFAGLHHRLETAGVLLEKPPEIEIRAQSTTPDYPEDFGKLELYVEPEDGSDSLLLPMNKRSDGTYGAEVEMKGEKLNFGVRGEHPATRWLLPDTESYVSAGRYNRPIHAQGTANPEKSSWCSIHLPCPARGDLRRSNL